MNLEQAKRILDIAQTDDKDDIKRKYRKMMGFFHPDALGSDHPKHVRRAQEINEAYELLKNYDALPSQKEADSWDSPRNEAAFCPRNIYLYYAMEGAKDRSYYRVAQGKYMWDPGEEEFDLFLTSIHHVTEELLEQCEKNASFGSWEENASVSEKRFQCQALLFQYLAMQYMNPAKTLKELAGPGRRDKQGREIYHFRAFLECMEHHPFFQRLSGLKAKEILYPQALLGSKIAVKDHMGRPLGHLSLKEDWAYFCMIPLLKERLAQIKMAVREVRISGGMRPYHVTVKVDLWIRLETGAWGYEACGINQRIQELLEEYEKAL